MPSLGRLPLSGNTEPVSESDLVRQLAQRIAAERMRLQLRELEEAHGELDRRTEARKLEREREAAKKSDMQSAADRDREAARLRDANAKEARENGAHAEQRKHSRRREIIQDVKREVVDNWLPVLLVSSELRAEIILEIERALTPLSVEELPRGELIDIAVAVRKRLYGKAEQEKRQIREKEEQQAERQTRLREHGHDYAERELKDAEGIDTLTRWQIRERVKRELGSVTGDESNADIEDWVDEILENEGLGYDDEGDDE